MEEAEECEVNFYNNDEEKFKGRGGHNQGVQEEPVTPTCFQRNTALN